MSAINCQGNKSKYNHREFEIALDVTNSDLLYVSYVKNQNNIIISNNQTHGTVIDVYVFKGLTGFNTYNVLAESRQLK